MWRSRRGLLLVATVLVLVLGAGAASVWRFTAHPPAQPVAHPPSMAPTASAAAPTAIPTPAFAKPARLVIPSIKVDAAVETVGVDNQGYIANPADSWNVAWFDGSVLPGQPGNAFLYGHVDWYAEPALGRPHGPRVFVNLSVLKIGEQVRVVGDDGKTLIFQVDAMETVPYSTPPGKWLSRTGPPTLTLETCAGKWDAKAGTYESRLIVHANLLGH